MHTNSVQKLHETWHLTVYHCHHLVSTAQPPPPLPPQCTRPPAFDVGERCGRGQNRFIIRSHCSALPLLCPPPTPSHPANGSNLYALSALMSSHAERWPYHWASGSHHLSPSPAACQAQCVDGQAGRLQEWGLAGGGGGTHLSPFSCKLL